jgi:hypothetical protein
MTTAPSIKPVQKASYAIPWTGDPRCHEELSWWATEDDRVLGVVIRDRNDDDFSWVVLMQEPGGVFCAIDLAINMPSSAIAAEALHAAMRAKVPYEMEAERFQ